MRLEVDPNPPVVGPGRLMVTLADEAGRPVEAAELRVEGGMDHEGMSPRWSQGRASVAGLYEAPFVYSMAGEWNFNVSATLPGGQKLDRQFALVVHEAPAAGHADHHDEKTVPNHGAAVRIVTPADGAIFQAGQEIGIKIETTAFPLGQAGNHWHVYVDDEAPRMVMGRMDETTLQGLPPGRHRVSVYLSNDDHLDLEEGATVTITVAGPELAGRRN